MRIYRPFVLLICVLTGCAELIIRPTDPPETVTGKVLGRVVSCAATICLSEVAIAQTKDKEEREATRARLIENWNQAIGHYTYDDALRQFGPPTSVAEGQDVFIAVWQGPAGPMLLFPGPSLGFGAPYFGAQVPGSRRELTFDKRTKRLTSWRFW